MDTRIKWAVNFTVAQQNLYYDKSSHAFSNIFKEILTNSGVCVHLFDIKRRLVSVKSMKHLKGNILCQNAASQHKSFFPYFSTNYSGSIPPCFIHKEEAKINW